jgi:hypothetical protein
LQAHYRIVEKLGGGCGTMLNDWAEIISDA